MRVNSHSGKVYRSGFVRIATVILLLTFNQTFSQKVTATVDREKIFIGEQVELLLKAEDIESSKFTVEQWFNVPDSFNHFEVVKRSSVDTVMINGNFSYLQKITLTSFDSGYWQLPAFFLSLSGKKNLATESLGIAVMPVDVSNLKDYHDIKEIIDVEPFTDWLLIGCIALGSILVLILIIMLIRYLRKRKHKIKSSNKVLSIEEALQQIETLRSQGLINKGQHKLFYTELINICRRFSNEQLHIFSETKTTDEYMLLLKGKVGTEPVQVKYFQLLRLADAVKFAKFIPVQTECDEAIDTAKAFVKTIHQYQFQQKANAV